MAQKTFKSLFLGLVLAALALVLVPPGSVLAEEDLKLHLSSEAGPPRETPPLGEFRVSLDSGLLTPERRFSLIADEFQPQPYRLGDNRLVLRGAPQGNAGLANEGLPRGPAERRLKDFSSTLTWTAAFLEASPANAKTALGAGRRLGRWAVYGEFARESVPHLPTDPADKTSVALPGKILANKLVLNSHPPDSGTRPLDPHRADESITAMSLDKYYLEAIYNFLPSFQGKVSYDRAIAETRDQKEKLQVEGIVEAGKDVVIKAGYRNESVPELKSNRSANDTKVWTEFILKF